MRDGVKIGAAIYAPQGEGRYPALLDASPTATKTMILPVMDMP